MDKEQLLIVEDLDSKKNVLKQDIDYIKECLWLRRQKRRTSNSNQQGEWPRSLG